MLTTARNRHQVRRIALRVGASVGLAAAASYALGAARFRRESTKGFELVDPPVAGSAGFTRLVEGVTGAPVRSGNRVQVLRNGDETFPAMLEAIADAQRTIDFSSYIYWPGEVTDRFTEAFVERARAGVEVRIALDAYGCARLDRAHVDRLEDAGVRVAFSLRARWYNIDKANNRMHRRLLIVDGSTGFAGGVGIADVWTGNATDPEHWRETHLRLEGPAVRDVFAGFRETWTEATGEILAGDHVPDLAPLDGGIDVQVTRSSPTVGGTAAAEFVYAALAGAEKRIWLTTAYFTAGRVFMDALAEAARRGVDVRLVLNGPNIDKEVVRKSGQQSYGHLLRAGVRIFEYQPTMLHAKVLIIDGWANVGSSNFDNRSLALDSELNVSLWDEETVDTLVEQFNDDLEVCHEVELAAWRSRPWSRRVVESATQALRQSF